MSIKIRESVSEPPVRKGNRWRVIVARPGKGSSGTYSEDLFRRDAEKIIAPGGQMFINHEDSRNPKDMVAVYPEGSFWDEDEKAVVAEAEVFSHWKSFVEEVGPHCGVSLYALGESDEDGNITAIIEDRLNGADLVSRPGLVGSGLAEKLYESAKMAESNEKPGVTSARETKGIKMDQEIKDAFAALHALIAPLVAKEEARAADAAQVEADEAAVSKAVESYDAAVKAIDEADLLPSQIDSLRAEAKKGADVAPLIEAAKQVKADAIAALGESNDDTAGGRVISTRTVESAVDLGKALA